MAETNQRSTSTRWLEPETLAQSVGIALVMTCLSRGAGLLRSIVFARLMARAELGSWAITNNTMQLLSVVLVLGIPGGICRYVERYQNAGRLRSFLKQVSAVCVGIALVACLAGIVLCRPLARVIFEDPRLTVLTVLTCLGTLSLVALNTLQGILQGLRVYRINAWLLVFQSVGFALVGSLMLWLWRPDAVAGATAFLVVCVLVTALPAWLLWRRLPGDASVRGAAFSTGTWRSILGYSLGTWGTGSLTMLWRVFDRYMLIHTDTLGATACLQEIGSYHIVENITGPLLALGGMISVLVLPHAVHLWEARRDREAGDLIQLATKLTVLGLTAAAAGLVVLKRWVLLGIFGDASPESGEILELVLAANIVVASHSVLRSYLLCRERAFSVTVVWAGGLLLNFLLNLVLIPAMHLKGATIASLVSACFSTAVVMALTHRAGMRVSRSTWLVCALPLALLAPPLVMLAALASASIGLLTSDWLLSGDDKRRINMALADRVLRRRSPAGTATA